jgi:hypothetical protein
VFGGVPQRIFPSVTTTEDQMTVENIEVRSAMRPDPTRTAAPARGAFRRDTAWKVATDCREDETVARYRRRRALGRDIAEAVRAANAMAHLEFSLRLSR